MVAGNFLRYEHKGMWEIAGTPKEVLITLTHDKGWIDDPKDRKN